MLKHDYMYMIKIMRYWTKKANYFKNKLPFTFGITAVLKHEGLTNAISHRCRKRGNYRISKQEACVKRVHPLPLPLSNLRSQNNNVAVS